jgi:hypothetical protein
MYFFTGFELLIAAGFSFRGQNRADSAHFKDMAGHPLNQFADIL